MWGELAKATNVCTPRRCAIFIKVRCGACAVESIVSSVRSMDCVRCVGAPICEAFPCVALPVPMLNRQIVRPIPSGFPVVSTWVVKSRSAVCRSCRVVHRSQCSKVHASEAPNPSIVCRGWSVWTVMWTVMWTVSGCVVPALRVMMAIRGGRMCLGCRFIVGGLSYEFECCGAVVGGGQSCDVYSSWQVVECQVDGCVGL